MAKSLYSAMFDWIILHVNHAMLNRRDMEESVSVSHAGMLRLVIMGFFFVKKKLKTLGSPDSTLSLTLEVFSVQKVLLIYEMINKGNGTPPQIPHEIMAITK